MNKLRTGKQYIAAIIAAPGAGKGTISKYLQRDFGFYHLSTGDMLRRHVGEGTPVGRRVESILKRGDLVDDETICEMVYEEKEGKELLLLDGYPRTIHQAESLGAIQLVIELQVPSETIIQRLSQRWIHAPSGRLYSDFNPPKIDGCDDITGEPLTQRDDDKPETIQYRLDHYNQKIQPLIDFYDQKNILATFSGNSSKRIYADIFPFLCKHLSDLSAGDDLALAQQQA